MVRRTTWVLLLVFGVLIIFAWLFQRYQANKTEATTTGTPVPTAQMLYDLTISQIVDINITNSDGNSIDFTREPGSTTWVIKNLPAEQADSFQIESISSQLLSLQVVDTLTQDPPLDAVGLTDPAYTITMTTTDRKQIITYVGSLSVIGTGYYLRVDSGPVVLIDNVTMDDVLHLLKEPPVLATATPDGTVTGTGTPIAPTAQPSSTP